MIAPQGRERAGSQLVALAEFIGAALLLRALGSFFDEHHLFDQLVDYGSEGAMNTLGGGEARFFLANCVAGLPAAALLADASVRFFGVRKSKPGEVHPRAAAIGFALFAVAVAAVCSRSILLGVELTDDERIYLFQARQLLAGVLASPLPANGAQAGMLVATHSGFAGVYPIGQPLLLALGLLVHAPHLSQLAFLAGTVYLAARLADDLWGPASSLLAGGLAATSPALILTAATLHNAVPATFFLLLAVRSTFLALKTGSIGSHALVGAALGAALLCRPYDAVAISLPIAAALLGPLFREKPARRIGPLCVAALCAAPFAFVYLATNRAITGDWLRPAYSLYLNGATGKFRVIGFGPAMYAEHTPELMFSKGVSTLVRLSSWAFGWPLSTLPLLAMLLGIGRDKPARLLLAILGVHWVAYALYTVNAVQDLGSPYHLVEVALLAVISARAIVAAGEWLGRFRPSLGRWPLAFALSSTLVALLTFWPAELRWLNQTAGLIAAPLRAAEEGAAGKPAIIFWKQMQRPNTPLYSWVLAAPLPGPHLDDPLLWIYDDPKTSDAEVALHPDRIPLRLTWPRYGEPKVVPYR